MHKLFTTKDGSNTLFDENFNETLHSGFGAYTEALHIFINNGLLSADKKDLSILEVGYGTGLNASLTAFYATDKELNVSYHGIEKFPPESSILSLFYDSVDSSIKNIACEINDAKWGHNYSLNTNFSIIKYHADFLDFLPSEKFDIIYFDPFSPEKHPQAWTQEFFMKLTALLHPNGFLITYSSKGIVKQALRACGLKVKRLPGPPGKRHILKAQKLELL